MGCTRGPSPGPQWHALCLALLVVAAAPAGLAQFVEECSAVPLPTGTDALNISYTVGKAGEKSAVLITISWAMTGAFAGVGFRAANTPGMSGLDIYVADSATTDKVLDCTLMAGSVMPVADASQDATLVSHALTEVSFYRLLSTGDADDFALQLDVPLGFAWALGTGSAGAGTWGSHQLQGRAEATLRSCSPVDTGGKSTAAPPTPAPATPAPETAAPAAPFVMLCGPVDIPTGDASVTISFGMGRVGGRDAIQFHVSWAAQYAAVGLRPADTAGMAGLDVYAFDVASPEVHDFQIVQSLAAPSPADAQQDAVVVSHTAAVPMASVVFYRLLKTGDSNDVELVAGSTVGFAWAVGSGAVSDGSWARHLRKGRMPLKIPLVFCDTPAPPTPAPPTEAPPTPAPPTQAPPTPAPETQAPPTGAPPTPIPGVEPTAAPPTPVPTPAGVFVRQCGHPVATGSQSLTLEYDIGEVDGLPAIQFTVQWTGDYGAVGLRSPGGSGMSGLDVYAFDTQTQDKVLDTKYFTGFNVETADSKQSATVVQHTGSKIVFHRLLDTGDFEDFSLTRGRDVTIAWATGPGLVFDGTWGQHSMGDRGTADITVGTCVTDAPPTPAPPTNAPPTFAPPLAGTFTPGACPLTPVPTGDNRMVLSYQFGTFDGEEAIKFVVAYHEDWGALGFRDGGSGAAGMLGFDIYAFDTVTPNVLDCATMSTPSGMPQHDPDADAYLESHSGNRLAFFRKTDTPGDYTLSQGKSVTVGWAVGAGEVFGMAWQKHTHQGTVTIDLQVCTPAPTPAPDTSSPPTPEPTGSPPTPSPATGVPATPAPPGDTPAPTDTPAAANTTTAAPTGEPPSAGNTTAPATPAPPSGPGFVQQCPPQAVATGSPDVQLSYTIGTTEGTGVPAVLFILSSATATSGYGAVGVRAPGGGGAAGMEGLDIYAFDSSADKILDCTTVSTAKPQQAPQPDTLQDAFFTSRSAGGVSFYRLLDTGNDPSLPIDTPVSLAWAVGSGGVWDGTWQRHTQQGVHEVVLAGCGTATPIATEAPPEGNATDDTQVPETGGASTGTPLPPGSATGSPLQGNATDECADAAASPCGEGQGCTDPDFLRSNDFVCVCDADKTSAAVGMPAAGCGVTTAPPSSGGGNSSFVTILCIVGGAAGCAVFATVAYHLLRKPEVPVEDFTGHLDVYEGELEQCLQDHGEDDPLEETEMDI